MDIELEPVDRITADAVGDPGERTFFLQARKDERVVTLLVEKQQVQLLAASVLEILARVGKETGEGDPEEVMGLEEPVVPEWRVGRLSIGYQEDRDLLLLEAEELVPEEDDDEAGVEAEAAGEGGEAETGGGDGGDAGLEELERMEALEEELEDLEGLEELAQVEGGAFSPSRVRFWATREQMLALARHGAEVCGRGRPTCRFCDQPMDPEGHVCPAMNGHREIDGA